MVLTVGIDVGSETHYARAFDWRNYEYSKKPLEFSNTEAGFQTFKAWMEDIADKHGKDVVLPGMEPTGHYWFALGKFPQDNGMKPVHVNPHHVKNQKNLLTTTPTKTTARTQRRLQRWSMKGVFPTPTSRLVFTQRSGVCQTCDSRRRKKSQGSRTG